MNAAELAQGFSDAGIERGDSILVHSSLSSLGWVEGGANAVVQALIDVVGWRGTVLFPTLTGRREDSPAKPPVFDARQARCWTGAIPEAARNRPEAIRSLHPTHSVAAIGEHAQWLTAGHHLVRTPCGFGSPYDKLADVGGKIVLIGVTQSANTSFHMAEEIAGVPYVVQEDALDIEMKDIAGQPVRMMDTRLHLWGPQRDYDSLEMQMLELGICHIRKVGSAEVRVMDAMLLRMFLVRRLLDDPLAVLDLTEREGWT